MLKRSKDQLNLPHKDGVSEVENLAPFFVTGFGLGGILFTPNKVVVLT